MALSTCTTIEQRGIVRFLWAKKMEAKDIHKEMLPMYGEHCLSCQAVHNWVQKFLEGWTNIEDEHQAGWPVEIATPETSHHIKDRGLVKWWDKCLNLYGDYVEK